MIDLKNADAATAFTFKRLSDNETINGIENLRNRKAQQVDDIPAKIMKDKKKHFNYFHSKDLNCYLSNGHFSE